MMTQGLYLRRLVGVVGTLGLFALQGCSSDDGLEKRYPVTGRVTYKGTSVAKGDIAFMPTQGGRPAAGKIEDGSYVLTTLTTGDGALPGKYKVTVYAKDDLDYATAEATAKKYIAKQSKTKEENITQALVPHRFIGKLQKQIKNQVPKKYAEHTTTDLTAEVAERTNTLDFELKD